MGRGAAFGDIDNDGDTDIIVGNNNGATRVLLNAIGSRNHWLGLKLVTAKRSGRDMLGARVAVLRDAQPTLWRRARADGSYASANDSRVLVGLGASTVVPRVRVLWPDGRVEEWSQYRSIAIQRSYKDRASDAASNTTPLFEQRV